MPIKVASRKSLPRVQRLAIDQARTKLGAFVTRLHVEKGYVILEDDGIPVAGLMDIDEFEDYLELKDPRVQRQIAESYREYLAGKSRPAEALLAELKKRKRAGVTASRRRAG